MKLHEVLGSTGYTKMGPGDPETWPKVKKADRDGNKSPDHNSSVIKQERQKKAKKWAEEKKAEMAKKEK